MLIQGVPPKYIQLNGNPTMYKSSFYTTHVEKVGFLMLKFCIFTYKIK